MLRRDCYAEARRFLREFKAADKMRIGFSGGNEGEWALRMNGAATVAEKFSECIASRAISSVIRF